VARYRESYGFVADGERIKILGEDIDGKTNGLEPILVKVDETFATICGAWDDSFEARLVAPLPPTDDDEEEVLSKNNSSVILRLDLTGDGKAGACRYLIGGDAEVAIWERIWEKYKDHSDLLTYDILVAPHHCSWHSLSNDRWSEMGDDAEVSEAARNALEQAGYGAVIVSSSCPIADDDDDPPCIRAKREYEDILKPQSGEFRCLGDGDDPEPVVFEVSWAGPKLKRASIAASVTLGTGLGTQPLQHG
jgi:hypothetical protein